MVIRCYYLTNIKTKVSEDDCNEEALLMIHGNGINVLSG